MFITGKFVLEVVEDEHRDRRLARATYRSLGFRRFARNVSFIRDR
ncbi:hypothetical protein [Planomonospora venezuelensis]|uniref:Uncharacterized protein n=1 Tax=Planomonospora venezuelensis TaxID=1999 RepID=A0A841DCZ1_PLAVE|nr:hypothetical protein [Planomonospora venezuelensis]MBB5967940.1 hypothetical protein [Planomonospora venezuelensis]GIN03332.1 hypothetical protein Pve01_49900 [Planomonospora venezuelensis]